MKKRRKPHQRGVALILVLGSIAIMTIMLTEFQDEATGELSSALADRDALKAEYLAKSGVNLARLVLASEPIVRQGLSLLFLGKKPPQVPIWEFSDRILGAFNDKEGSAEFAALTGTDTTRGKNLGIEGGRFDVEIIDEDAKININLGARGDPFTQKRLATQILALIAGDRNNPLFEQRDRDDNFTDRATACGAIIDWADADEDLNACDPLSSAPSTRAVEDASYQLLKKPYFRKNAAYDSLEELHLVRGVGDDFWATFVDPDPEKPNKRVMTVWGQGAVNVNTANAQTLWAVVCAYAVPGTKMCVDPMEMQKFLFGVTMARAIIPGVPLFSSGPDFIKALQAQPAQGAQGAQAAMGLQALTGQILKMLQIEPVVFTSAAEAGKTVTTESKIFSIYVDGIVPGYQRKTRVRIHTVVDFRSAPAPGTGFGLPQTGTTGTTGTTAGTTTGTSTTSGSLDAIQGALLPDPGGTIVYYRME